MDANAKAALRKYRNKLYPLQQTQSKNVGKVTSEIVEDKNYRNYPLDTSEITSIIALGGSGGMADTLAYL